METSEFAKLVSDAIAAHDRRTKIASPVWASAGAVGGSILSALMSYAAITGALEARLEDLTYRVQILSDTFSQHLTHHAIGSYDRDRNRERG